MVVQWLELMAFAGAWPLGAEALLLCPVATVEGGVTYLALGRVAVRLQGLAAPE